MSKPPSIRHRLRQWRKRHQLSQSQAAQKLGVPLGTYQGWEQGRRMPHALARVALLANIAD